MAPNVSPFPGSGRLEGWPQRLAALLSQRTATVGVVGLGYVGLPLLIAALDEGFPAIGVDLDPHKIRALHKQLPILADVATKDLYRLRGAELSSGATALGRADVVIIAVPTPLTDGEPDLSLVTRAACDVGRVLRPGQLVVLESTTYPGTTEEIVLPILQEESALVGGRDFALAYSPERIDPGSGRRLQDAPKIVAGVEPVATQLAELLYRQFGCETVRVPTPAEAEMAKLIENTFRQVNISLVNELAMVAADLNIDIWAALDAAATKPFGYMPFWPGPGIGGHCIAVDPSYLSWRAFQRRGSGVGFVEHARAINAQMPDYVVSRIADALNRAGKPIRGSHVLALGVSYKPGVCDTRESAAAAVLARLLAAGADCSYHDPFVSTLRLDGTSLQSQRLQPELLRDQDCVVILTAHPSIDFAAVARHSRIVFDAQGVTRGLHAPNVTLL